MKRYVLISGLLGAAMLAGCESSEVNIDINRTGDAQRLSEVVIEPTPVNSEGVYERSIVTDGKGHDHLTLKTKSPIRIRVIVEPILLPTTVLPPSPMPPTTQPAVPGRRQEP